MWVKQPYAWLFLFTEKKHHKKTNKLVFILEIVIFVADIIIYVCIESNLKYCKKYNNWLDFNVLCNGSCFSILISRKKYFWNLSEKCPGFTAAFCCGVYSNLTAFENPRERREKICWWIWYSQEVRYIYSKCFKKRSEKNLSV